MEKKKLAEILEKTNGYVEVKMALTDEGFKMVRELVGEHLKMQVSLNEPRKELKVLLRVANNENVDLYR